MFLHTFPAGFVNAIAYLVTLMSLHALEWAKSAASIEMLRLAWSLRKVQPRSEVLARRWPSLAYGDAASHFDSKWVHSLAPWLILLSDHFSLLNDHTVGFPTTNLIFWSYIGTGFETEIRQLSFGWQIRRSDLRRQLRILLSAIKMADIKTFVSRPRKTMKSPCSLAVNVLPKLVFDRRCQPCGTNIGDHKAAEPQNVLCVSHIWYTRTISNYPWRFGAYLYCFQNVSVGS